MTARQFGRHGRRAAKPDTSAAVARAYRETERAAIMRDDAADLGAALAAAPANTLRHFGMGERIKRAVRAGLAPDAVGTPAETRPGGEEAPEVGQEPGGGGGLPGAPRRGA